MGYDVHITRKGDWFEDEPQISLEEWLAAVEADQEMRLDGYADAPLGERSVLRTQRAGLSVWTAYSRDGMDDGRAWFDHRDGNITVKNPDAEILGKMWVLARAMGAKVQGDDGEIYDALGNARVDT